MDEKHEIPASLQLGRDRKLVKDILEGDEKALRVFFDTYLPRLYRYARHRLANPSDIDDVVQAALSQAVRRLETWRGESTLLTWLITICRHEISKELKEVALSRDLMQPFLSDELLRSTVEMIELEEDEATEQMAARAEVAQLIRFTLDQLPENYAVALEMKYIFGGSSMEIARKLSLSDSATQSLLARARRAFKELYSESLLSATQGG
ncbi:RNA polymerase sigma factor [Congregibacter litoralis]|uniref:RNA polymerase sigma factor, sigma-70 family n=1 Tax=Congregibacter litoralis KT71 TaxID=314285 RepID=A4AAF3_9GAMM|nr:RNA polymerase sigma factor [Congregibacter litoralis]EAQ97030.1 RNA polymerase sigma factor, sigma-70 family [Congregibacter litoralis KT71]